MVPGPALKCQSPADVYLLLKSSDFISHDLDHAFELCIDTPSKAVSTGTTIESTTSGSNQEDLIESTSRLRVIDESGSNSSSSDEEEGEEVIKVFQSSKKDYEFELVLKKWFDMPKSQEWRCFVKDKKLIG